MGLFVGEHLHIAPVEGPKAYEIRTGRKYLDKLEGGDVRCWPEYHLILIDERTGYLTIEGAFGTFSYGWPAVARGPETLHSFLYNLDFGYFMEKSAKQPYRVADVDATIAKLRREILRDRRDGSLERHEARDLWSELDDESDDDLVGRLYGRSSAWAQRLDYSDPTVMIDHPAMRRFWEEVWRPFAERVLRLHWLQHMKQRPVPRSRALVAA